MKTSDWKSSIGTLLARGRHPDLVELVNDIHGELAPLRSRLVGLHLEHCPACRKRREMVSDTFLKLKAVRAAATAEETCLLELGKKNLIDAMARLQETDGAAATAPHASESAGSVAKVVELLRLYLGEPAATKVLLGSVDSSRLWFHLDDSLQVMSTFLGREKGDSVKERVRDLLKENGLALQSTVPRL